MSAIALFFVFAVGYTVGILSARIMRAQKDKEDKAKKLEEAKQAALQEED